MGGQQGGAVRDRPPVPRRLHRRPAQRPAARTGRRPIARSTSRTPSAFFLRRLSATCSRCSRPHAAIYCWHAHKRCGEIQQVWARARHPRPPADRLGQAHARVRAVLLALPPRAVHDGLAEGAASRNTTATRSSTRSGRSTGRGRPGSSATPTRRRSPSRSSPGRCASTPSPATSCFEPVLRQRQSSCVAAEQTGRASFRDGAGPPFAAVRLDALAGMGLESRRRRRPTGADVGPTSRRDAGRARLPANEAGPAVGAGEPVAGTRASLMELDAARDKTAGYEQFTGQARRRRRGPRGRTNPSGP